MEKLKTKRKKNKRSRIFNRCSRINLIVPEGNVFRFQEQYECTKLWIEIYLALDKSVPNMLYLTKNFNYKGA